MCCGLARWHFVLFGGRGVDGDTLAHRMVQPMPLGNSEQAGSTPAVRTSRQPLCADAATVPMRAFCRWPVFRHAQQANWAPKKRFESARPPFQAARYTGFMQSLPVQSLDGRVAGHLILRVRNSSGGTKPPGVM